jgi:hypothetical protein
MRSREKILITLLLAFTSVLTAPTAAGAATTFGADLSKTPETSGGNTTFTQVIKPGGAPDNGAPVSGVLVSVRVKTTGFAGTAIVRLLTEIGRPSATVYALVNVAPEIPVPIDFDGTVAGHVTEVPVRRPISVGQRLALFMFDPGFATLRLYGGGPTGDCAYLTGTHPPGTGRNYDNLNCNNNLPLVAATIEADADADGFGDETQDQCPTNALVQTACPVAAALPTGQRDAALKKCKRKKSKKARKKCKKKALLLPA